MNRLETIRDYLRFAVSRFREAKLAHGHGASSTIDEAAFLILESLHLPVDDINPWLDARLTEAERKSLAELIGRRVSTRKPAAYLLGKTYLNGVPFKVDERVIVPRSYIAELLANEPAFLPENVTSILDLCTGSGCLAILAAMMFPGAKVDAADISPDALAVARENVGDHEMEDRISLHEGDLFKPLGKRRYDLILCNPPYVAEAEVAAFPPEYANEPKLAHLGGKDGFDIVRKILAEAPKHLSKGGGLLCEIGTGRDILEAEFPHLDLLWLDTAESQGEVFWLSA
jgi:ribosomal protein L3 glutamine methyltransferase